MLLSDVQGGLMSQSDRTSHSALVRANCRIEELEKALERLRDDFEREALSRYRRDEDGSDWQEAWRRVSVMLREVGG